MVSHLNYSILIQMCAAGHHPFEIVWGEPAHHPTSLRNLVPAAHIPNQRK